MKKLTTMAAFLGLFSTAWATATVNVPQASDSAHTTELVRCGNEQSSTFLSIQMVTTNSKFSRLLLTAWNNDFEQSRVKNLEIPLVLDLKIVSDMSESGDVALLHNAIFPDGEGKSYNLFDITYIPLVAAGFPGNYCPAAHKQIH